MCKHQSRLQYHRTLHVIVRELFPISVHQARIQSVVLPIVLHHLQPNVGFLNIEKLGKL